MLVYKKMAKGDQKSKNANAASKTVDKKPKKAEKEEVIEAKPEVETTTKQVAAEDHSVVFDQQLEVIAQLKRNVDDAVRKLTLELKALKKQVAKDMKARSKGRGARAARQAKDGATRPLSGFTAPTGLSEELCKFLGKPAGTMMARTEVTKELNQYIKANKLNSGRDIMPNTELAKLLRSKNTDTVTYFNLQRFMKPHFAKKDGSFDATSA